MLAHLHVKNLALIEEIEVEFGPGLNILTGETGAGKSIVIDAISAVLGERTSRELIRTGAVLGLLVVFLPQNPERTVGLIVLGMICCEVFSAAVLFLLARRQLNRAGGLPGTPLRPRALDRRIAAIALPIGMTALLGNLMGSANAVLIPQRLVAAGAQVSEAMSAFGVLCGMTIPMLYLPTAFIGALGLVLVPKLSLIHI